ncbi:hypothetical protein [Sansalvadorimonas verongulae]|uniref:hypothetical protein n=1 Tax=Sansalvadorimonas verongulae TaxID=2172824 RepID=UPI0018AD1C47|nr:hypothetical protein [Sansalvadorimonas verongulae]
MTPKALKNQQKDFEKFVNKRKSLAKSFYKAQKIHHKQVQDHLRIIKQADDLIKAGDTSRGSELLFKSVEGLSGLRRQNETMKSIAAVAVAERTEVRASLSVETMPDWFLSFERRLDDQLILGEAVDQHYMDVFKEKISFDGRYEAQIVDHGRNLATALKNAGTAR